MKRRCANLCGILLTIWLLSVANLQGAELPRYDSAIDNAAATPSEQPYCTPLAGKPLTTTVFGNDISIPARDRNNVLALVLGVTLFEPAFGDTELLPIGALYAKHRWGDTRFRGTFSILVNDLDISRSFGNLQLLGHLDNNTVPFPSAEIAGGHEVKRTSIEWGEVNGRLGIGLRLPVQPFECDNDLRIQFFYQGGYLYSRRVAETGRSVRLPPDTLVHGPLFRIRYDGLHRNLMELPHGGVAAGFDADFGHRDTWSDANYGGALYTRDETRDYLKVSGYLIAAGGIPGLSERNRLIASFYGGFAPYGALDRFSAFRIGGGPFPSESDDLYRQVYPGAMFSQFPASDYLIGALEYRRELLFFLYLHLRSTFAWVNRDIFTARRLRFLADSGQAFSAGITTGMPWDSELYLEYSYDTHILRNGNAGSNVLVLWSKSF